MYAEEQWEEEKRGALLFKMKKWACEESQHAWHADDGRSIRKMESV